MLMTHQRLMEGRIAGGLASSAPPAEDHLMGVRPVTVNRQLAVLLAACLQGLFGRSSAECCAVMQA